MNWRQILKLIKKEAFKSGFDLAQPFQVQWYNKRVKKEFQLPNYNRTNTLGILIGNSRHLWPHFLKEIHKNKDLRKTLHPLDQYTRQNILKILEKMEIPWSVFWAELHASQKIAFQKLALISGLADLSPSHLNVHPQYGPWIAFRSAIVFDSAGPQKKPQPVNLCKPCTEPCMKPFQEALNSKRNSWKKWLKVREACPFGEKFKYSHDQILYHYAKKRTEAEIEARAIGPEPRRLRSKKPMQTIKAKLK